MALLYVSLLSLPPRLRHCFLILIHLMQLACDGAYVIPRNTGNADKYPYDATSYSNFREYLYVMQC